VNSEVENTPLWYEILDVLTKCDQESQAYWEVEFIINEAGDVYKPFQLTQFSLERDYAGGYCDAMGITATIPFGKYAERIYKNRNQLRATLTRFPLLEKSTLIDYSKGVKSEEFIAILKEPSGTMQQMKGTEAKDERSLDLMGFVEVQFQLFNKADERVRIATIGGIYRKVKLDELIKYSISNTVNKHKVSEERKILGVDIVPINNTKAQEQVILTHGMHLYDLPGFLQKTYGIYNAGLGTYVQGRYWYVFPLFDTKRYSKAKETYTLYVLPKKKFPEIERTYRVLGTDVAILTTTETDFRADTNRNQVEDGGGVRFTNADTMMDGFGVAKGNKFKVKRKENNSEFKSQDRQVHLDYAPIANARITSNPFAQYSDLLLRIGGIMTVLWENSKPNIIKPGMPCRVVYFDDNQIKEAYGITLGVNHVVQKIGDFNMKKHSSNTRLQIFVNLKKENQ
jgi:hypothetical protein